MKALVIWQVVPENVKYYIHNDITEEGIVSLRKCHGELINIDHSEEVDIELNELQEELDREDSAFKPLPVSEVCECKPDFICVTGFYL